MKTFIINEAFEQAGATDWPRNDSYPSNVPLERQYDAPNDLKVVSWPERLQLPPSAALGDLPYVYDGRRSRNPKIYLIDSGVNIAHQVSTEAFPSSIVDIAR